MDNGLTWKVYIWNIRNSANLKLNLLYPLINIIFKMSQTNSFLSFNSLILLLFIYACPIWVYVAKTHMYNLQIVQSKFLRILLDCLYYVGKEEFINIFQVVALYNVIKKNVFIFYRKNTTHYNLTFPFTINTHVQKSY